LLFAAGLERSLQRGAALPGGESVPGVLEFPVRSRAVFGILQCGLTIPAVGHWRCGRIHAGGTQPLLLKPEWNGGEKQAGGGSDEGGETVAFHGVS
jgi:hypothetical protein